LKAKFIIEDGSIEYKGEYNFLSGNYVGRWLMTSGCNIPRKVISDRILDGERTINLVKMKIIT
jgi:hypothetical protein